MEVGAYLPVQADYGVRADCVERVNPQLFTKADGGYEAYFIQFNDTIMAARWE